MRGFYRPINDGMGFIGYSYICPECNHETMFVDCETGCEICLFSELYIDADEWYDEEMKKPVKERAWNTSKGKI